MLLVKLDLLALGIIPVPLKGILDDLLATLPNAIVPSWQERHITEEPSGWPIVALSVLLAYKVYEVPGSSLFQRGCLGFAACGV
jgi:hypothetical protein